MRFLYIKAGVEGLTRKTGTSRDCRKKIVVDKGIVVTGQRFQTEGTGATKL